MYGAAFADRKFGIPKLVDPRSRHYHQHRHDRLAYRLAGEMGVRTRERERKREMDGELKATENRTEVINGRLRWTYVRPHAGRVG